MEVEQINSIINSLQEISKQISTVNSFDSYLTIISILINIVLVVVVFFQLKFYRDEMNTRLRPWIGITQFKRNQFNKIGFSYQNFGQTPPIRVRIKVKHARREITLEEVKVELDEKDEIGLIMPDQTKYYLIKDIDEEAIVNVQNEQGNITCPY